MAVDDLEKIAIKVFGADRVFTEPMLIGAIDRAVKDSVRPLSDESFGVLITGSVVTVGEARIAVRRKFSKEGEKN
jgi:dihydrofolate synthase/folylpolyglutamate synthase